MGRIAAGIAAMTLAAIRLVCSAESTFFSNIGEQGDNMHKPAILARLRETILFMSLAILALLTYPNAAYAQGFQFSPPYIQPDSNGVDAASGAYIFSLPTVTFGTGDGALSWTWSFSASGTDQVHVWKDNFAGHLTTSDAPDAGTLTPVEYDGQYTVFQIVNGQYSRGEYANGSSLTAGPNKDYFIYRLRDGREIRFDHYITDGATTLNYCSTTVGGITGCRYFPTFVKYPNGKTLSFAYAIGQWCSITCFTSSKLVSITSNFGIQLTYVASSPAFSSGLSAIRLSRVGDSSQTITVGFSQPNNNTQIVTFPGGRSWKFNMTDSINEQDGTPLRPLTSIESPNLQAGKIQITYNSGLCPPGSGDCGNEYFYGTVTSVSAGGVTTTYARHHNPATGYTDTTVTDTLGHTKVVSTPGYGGSFLPARPVSVADELGHVSTYAYDQYERMIRSVSPEGIKTEYTYDDLSNITRVTVKAKASSGMADINYYQSFPPSCTTFVLCFQPLTKTDANGGVTNYAYDGVTGQITSEALPAPSAGAARPITTYAYTSIGGVQVLASASHCRISDPCAGAADQIVTSNTTDSRLFPTQQTETADGLSFTTAKTYDSMGNVTSVDGPITGTADTTYYRYDENRQVIGVVSPDPDGAAGSLPRPATRNTYNLMGQLTASETGTVADITDAAWAQFQPAVVETSVYDQYGRVVVKSKSAGGSVYNLNQLSYDALGRIECTAVRMNLASYNPMPANLPAACALGIEGNQGRDRVTRNFYDAAGQLVQIRRAVGTPIEQAYATYTYSLDGKTASLADANGNVSTYSYDGFDRQARWYFPSATTAGISSGSDYEAYTYDPNGNRTSLRKRDGRLIGYTFDKLNRLAAKSIGGTCILSAPACAPPPAGAARSVYYSYDLRGLQTGAHFDSLTGADAVINQYDGFGRLTATTTQMGTVSRTIGHQYDANGARISTTWPDALFTTYRVDGLGRPDRLYEGSSATLANIGYQPFGPRYSVSRASGLNSFYSYDLIQRLSAITHDFAGATSDVTLAFSSYNPANQIVTRGRDNPAYAFSSYVPMSKTYLVNGLNQYAAIDGSAFVYDANGNLTSTGATSLVYDVENRLVRTTGGLDASLTYDPLGRLFQVANSSGTSGITQFLYDGNELAAEYNSSGTMTARYIHGDGEDDPMVWYNGAAMDSTTRRFMHEDNQGSIVAISDSAGNNVAHNTYDEYGLPGGGNVGRFQYTGQAWLEELGMYYYKARIYSPKLGRFLQSDPIGYDDQNNLYAYAGNDPVNGRDPAGTDTLNCTVTEVTVGRVTTRTVNCTTSPNDSGKTTVTITRNGVAGKPHVVAGKAYTDPDAMRRAWGVVTDITGVKMTYEGEVNVNQPYANNAQAAVDAKARGWINTGKISAGGAPIWRDPKSGMFYTRDRPAAATGDSHNGGAWKGATSAEGLRSTSKAFRSGTYNRLLERVGD